MTIHSLFFFKHVAVDIQQSSGSFLTSYLPLHRPLGELMCHQITQWIRSPVPSKIRHQNSDSTAGDIGKSQDFTTDFTSPRYVDIPIERKGSSPIPYVQPAVSMDRPCRWAVPCRHLRTWLPRTSSPTPPKQVIPVIPSRIDFLDHETHIKKQQIHQRWRSGPTRQSGFFTRPAGDLMNHLSWGEHQHLVDIISTDPRIFQNFSQRSSVVKAKIHGHYHPQVMALRTHRC